MRRNGTSFLSTVFIVGILLLAFALAYPKTTLAFILLVVTTVILNIVWRVRLDKKIEAQYLNSGIEDIDKMSGIEFERRLAVHFNHCGWIVNLTKTSGDFGADLLGVDAQDQKVVIQAKRYQKNIGVCAVQEVISAKSFHNAKRPMVITNQYFTKPLNQCPLIKRFSRSFFPFYK